MAHARYELRLVLARLLQLAALVLDLTEKARILDRQYGLRGEGLQEFDDVLRKFTGLLTPDHERPDDAVCANQRHDQTRSKSGAHCDLSHWAWRLVADIGNLLRLSRLRRLADRIGSAEVLVLHGCNQIFAETIRGPQAK